MLAVRPSVSNRKSTILGIAFPQFLGARLIDLFFLSGLPVNPSMVSLFTKIPFVLGSGSL